jgi:hypothetical protein
MVGVVVLGVSWSFALGTHSALAQSVALATGQRHSGRLEASDPRVDGEGRYDEFAYVARAGERIVIHMQSPDFDAFVRWGRGAGGAFQQLARDDDSGNGTDARLEVVADGAGTYLIRATSFAADALGMYTLEVANADSPPALPTVTAGRSVEGSLGPDDRGAAEGAPYDLYAYAASAGERLEITLSSGEFDAYLSWGPREDKLELHNDDDSGTNSRLDVTVPSSGTYVIRAKSFIPAQMGGYVLRVERMGAAASTSGTGGGTATRAARPIDTGQTIEAQLGEGDPRAPDGAYYHHYFYVASAGERLVITMGSRDFDTYLSWGRADADYSQHDDDGGDGTDSRLVVTVSASGIYMIRAKAYREGAAGAYTLHVERSTGAAAPSSPAPVASAPSSSGNTSAGVSTADIRAYLERGLTSRRAIGIEAGQIALYHSMSVHRFFQVDRSARYTVALIFESGPTRVGEVTFVAVGGLARLEDSFPASDFERPFAGYEMAAWEYTGQELLDAFSGSQYGVEFVVSIDQPEYRNAVLALLVSP